MAETAALAEPQRRKREGAKPSERGSCERTRTRQRARRLQQAMEIRHRVALGQRNGQIIKEMRIPTRTFFRRLSEAYEHDAKMMEQQSKESLPLEIMTLRDRLTQAYARMLKTCEDDRVAIPDRLKAEAAGCELAVLLARVALESPMIVRDHADLLKEL